MDRTTREHILTVALKHFADRGYAGSSVQEIVDEASVGKPMLYYYFESKAGLYQALIDTAHDERFRVMCEAAEAGASVREKLCAMLSSLFRYIENHRELVRLAFASAFAAPGEMPEGLSCREKCERNFAFIRSLMEEGLQSGELDSRFGSQELAVSWYGLVNIYTAGQVLQPTVSYTEETARTVADLFLNGAASSARTPRRDSQKEVISQLE